MQLPNRPHPEMLAAARQDRCAAIDLAQHPIHTRIVAAVRAILALSSLAAVRLESADYARPGAFVYAGFIVYVAFSLASVARSRRYDGTAPAKIWFWADVVLISYLVALTGGIGSLFFPLYFLSILQASFTLGFREGLVWSVRCTVAFLLAAWLARSEQTAFALDAWLIRPIWLLGLGYLSAYWGGHEVRLRQKLLLLSRLQASFNPRLGVDRLIGSGLTELRDFCDARSCLLAMPGQAQGSCIVHQADRDQTGSTLKRQQFGQPASRMLLGLGDQAGIYPLSIGARMHAAWLRWRARSPRASRVDRERLHQQLWLNHVYEAVASLLDSRLLVTAPYHERGELKGRVFMVFDRVRVTRVPSAEFLTQWAAALGRLSENASLTEEVALRAAQQERTSVSRDLHDTTIQPYIGLKLAIESVARRAEPGSELARELAGIAQMADATILELRDHVSGILAGRLTSVQALGAAIERQAERLKRHYGIQVESECPDLRALDERIAGAAFKIVLEGLANVLRHTGAKRARVAIRAQSERLLLAIENEVPGGKPVAAFTPRSIVERANELGGTVEIRQDNQTTSVQVQIPLHAMHGPE